MLSNLYIFSNGNNDLSYHIRNSCNALINKFTTYNTVNVYGAFTYTDIDKERLWTSSPKPPIYFECENYAFSYCNHILKPYSINSFYTELKNGIKFLDIRKFLRFFSCSTYTNNIVVLSGHGGLFQSFLDLSQQLPFALNTINLCNYIKQFPIDLLILDMCSMNYIEIAYELLKNSQIKNIIFFKGLVPLEGLDLSELYDTIHYSSENIENVISNLLSIKKYPLFLISQKSIEKLELVKLLLHKIGYNIITNQSIQKDSLDGHLKVLLNNVAIEGIGCCKTPGFPLKFISYELNEFDEKIFYRCYKFSNNNYWGNIVSKGVFVHPHVTPSIVIPFTKENLRHLILIHNSTLSKESLNNLYNTYITPRIDTS